MARRLKCSAAFPIFLVLACSAGESKRVGYKLDITDPITLDVTGDSVDLIALLPSISGRGDIAAYQLAPPGNGAALFNADGRFERSVSKQGKGPGEIGSVTSIGFGPGDTLWIVDQMFAAHAYAPDRSREFVRSIHTKSPMDGRTTPFGILSPPLLWTNNVRPPVLTDWEGQEVRRFGSAQSPERVDAVMGAVYAVDSTAIWSASGDSYAVSLLGPEGEVHRRVGREVEWFPAGLATTGPPWAARPRPQIKSITVDQDGLLWLLIRRAHRDWKPTPLTPERANTPIPVRSMPSAIDVNKLFEGVIEVFDTTSGRLLASHEVSGDVIGFPAPGRLCEVVETNGLITLRIWTIDLHR